MCVANSSESKVTKEIFSCQTDWVSKLHCTDRARSKMHFIEQTLRAMKCDHDSHIVFWQYKIIYVLSLIQYIILYYIILYYIILYYIILYHIISYYIILYHIISYYIILYHVILCYVMLCYVMLCYVMLYYYIRSIKQQNFLRFSL